MPTRSALTIAASICLATLTANASDIYWSRPLLKTGLQVGASGLGEGLIDDTPTSFFDGDSDSTGTTTATNNSTANMAVFAMSGAGAGGSYADTEIQAGLVTNNALQASSTAELLLQFGYQAASAAGEWFNADFGHSAIMEAEHVLLSSVYPQGTPVGCVCKCILIVEYTNFYIEQYFDWVIFGWPGLPAIYMDGMTCIAWTTDEYAEQYIEESGEIDGASDIMQVYADFPGVLEVGDTVYYMSSAGTGGENSSGLAYQHSEGPIQIVGTAQVSAKIWLQTDEEP
jgi:hypothetical protein